MSQAEGRVVTSVRPMRAFEVAPFVMKRCGTELGLIIREPEEEEGVWAVEVHPGNYMAFSEPWDSGVYDT